MDADEFDELIDEALTAKAVKKSFVAVDMK